MRDAVEGHHHIWLIKIMYALIFLLIILAITVPFFLSRRLSPIPYFPTNNADIPLITKTLRKLELKQRNNGPVTIVDLGAGTGRVLFEASQQSLQPQRLIMIENNPWLVLILKIKRLFHPNKDAIEILAEDMFNMGKTDLPHASIVYIYVGPYVIERVKKLLEKMPKGTYVVSYMYTIPGWEKRLREKKQGVHTVHIYKT